MRCPSYVPTVAPAQVLIDSRLFQRGRTEDLSRTSLREDVMHFNIKQYEFSHLFFQNHMFISPYLKRKPDMSRDCATFYPNFRTIST